MSHLNMRCGKRELEAMASLEGNQSFKVLLDYWKRRLGALAISSTKMSDDTVCRWTQGRAQEVSFIISEIETARTNLEMSKTNPGVTGTT